MCHLATGDMLRDAVSKQTPLGLEAKHAMETVIFLCSHFHSHLSLTSYWSGLSKEIKIKIKITFFALDSVFVLDFLFLGCSLEFD